MKRIFWENVKKWNREHENKLERLLSLFSGIILVGSLVLYLFGLLNIIVFFSTVVTFLPILLGFYLYVIKKKEKNIAWINVASVYLLGEKVSKIGNFFDKLKLKCQIDNDFETRRKIAETLPELFEIDFEESKELKEILRRDWDEKWKSDNRRRAIEALSNIIHKDKKLVKDNLNVIDGDEIFTIISIVEVLDVWREKINKDEATALFRGLKNELEERGEYESEEITAIDQLWYILGLVHHNPARAIKMFEELKNSPNIYIQICIARNLNHLCKRFPEKTLELMDYFIKKEKHRYVRRVISKEKSVECLVSLLQDKRLSIKAKEIIWKLIIDEDDLIMVTTFDKIEKILDIDNEFGKSILQQIIEKNTNPKLVERAKNLLKRYD